MAALVGYMLHVGNLCFLKTAEITDKGGLNNQYYSSTSNLQSHGIDFPVVIDKYNDFRSINHSIPADSRYHTFLLDRNNRVVLVGNPLASDAMWSLFRKTLDNMLANDGLYIPE